MKAKVTHYYVHHNSVKCRTTFSFADSQNGLTMPPWCSYFEYIWDYWPWGLTESGTTHSRLRVVMVPTSSSLAAPEVVVKTISSADKVGIMATLGFQCSFSGPCPAVSSYKGQVCWVHDTGLALVCPGHRHSSQRWGQQCLYGWLSTRLW